MFFANDGTPPRTRGHPHVHPPDESAADVLAVVGDLKNVARANPLRPALAVVEDELLRHPADLPFDSLPNPLALKRAVNRARASVRPREPRDLTFTVDYEFIGAEHFLIADIRGEGYRHIVLGTEAQLLDLAAATSWFMDSTFKIVGAPFRQLFSIHTFAMLDGCRVQQFPQVFALMSRKRASDYEAVLR